MCFWMRGPIAGTCSSANHREGPTPKSWWRRSLFFLFDIWKSERAFIQNWRCRLVDENLELDKLGFHREPLYLLFAILPKAVLKALPIIQPRALQLRVTEFWRKLGTLWCGWTSRTRWHIRRETMPFRSVQLDRPSADWVWSGFDLRRRVQFIFERC